jgi:lipoprotein-anchoring transpeptidase ErfK/SrfK
VFPVAVGKRSTPTPTGRFFVTDVILIRNPYGAYGPAALGLSGHSNVLTRFGSGDGVLGIHGTNEPWSVGRSASHGCVRMRNRDVLALVRIAPTGTPVTIS